MGQPFAGLEIFSPMNMLTSLLEQWGQRAGNLHETDLAMLSDIAPQGLPSCFCGICFSTFYFRSCTRLCFLPLKALALVRSTGLWHLHGFPPQLDFDLWNQPCPSFRGERGENVINLFTSSGYFCNSFLAGVCLFAILVFTLLPGSPSSSTD